MITAHRVVALLSIVAVFAGAALWALVTTSVTAVACALTPLRLCVTATVTDHLKANIEAADMCT